MVVVVVVFNVSYNACNWWLVHFFNPTQGPIRQCWSCACYQGGSCCKSAIKHFMAARKREALAWRQVGTGPLHLSEKSREPLLMCLLPNGAEVFWDEMRVVAGVRLGGGRMVQGW